jgi:prophage regulatory protein
VTSDRLLRLSDVMERTGLGRSTIYRKISEGTFPAPVKVGQAAVRWKESDLAAWIAAL